MAATAAMGAQSRSAAEMLAETAVEAFDHAVGLRAERPGQTVSNPTLGANAIEGMLAGGFFVRLGLFVDGEAVGELGAVVGRSARRRCCQADAAALLEGCGK
jgi:hypothetical protein